MKFRSLVVAGVAASAFAAAPAAQAATDTTVSATVGTELSLALGSPVGTFTLSHSTPGTLTQPVTVTSTAASWTLKLQDDTNTTLFLGHTTGHMDSCTGGLAPVLNLGGTAVSSELSGAMQYSGDNSTFNNVPSSASPGTVTTGTAGVNTPNVYLKQALGSADNVTATSIYCITLGYTVS